MMGIVSTNTLALLATPLGPARADLAAGDRLRVLGSVLQGERLHVCVVCARSRGHVGLVGYVHARSGDAQSVRFLEPPPLFWWLTSREMVFRSPWQFMPPLGWALAGAAVMASVFYATVAL
jgi:hypothetical protein